MNSLFVALPIMLTTMACATASPRSAGGLPDALVVGPEGAGTFIDGRSGAVLPQHEVIARLHAVEVILVGEHHGTAAHHALQGNVALSLAASGAKGSTVAAIEWLPHSARLAVRGWLGGNEAVDALAVATAWRETWGHDFDAYAGFFERLRRAGVAIEPINAEPGLARAVARGLELEPEKLALLPPLDSGTPAHRAWFEEQMSGMHGHHHHGAGQTSEAVARMDRLYRAQLVWDETMARNVLTLLQDGFERVVVCAGMGHTTRGLGVPARLGNRSRLIIHPVESTAEALARASNVQMPGREADIFWVPPSGQVAIR